MLLSLSFYCARFFILSSHFHASAHVKTATVSPESSSHTVQTATCLMCGLVYPSMEEETLHGTPIRRLDWKSLEGH